MSQEAYSSTMRVKEEKCSEQVKVKVKIEKDVEAPQAKKPKYEDAAEPKQKKPKYEHTAKSKGKKPKYQHAVEHQLSGYNKKQILTFLKTHGCNANMFQEAVSRFKVSKESAIEFFQKYIDEAEMYVHQECESLCFENANAWLNLFKECGLMKACNYEHAIVMNAIAYNENHPKPEELGGIDLREVYEFLTRSLMGLPQNELTSDSAAFLATEFESLIEQANSNTGDEQTGILKSKLESLSPLQTGQPSSIDPLQLQPEHFTI